MIHIDYQGGVHGNYLEFICNVAAGVEVGGLPFNKLGASHKKFYKSKQIFYSGHYSYSNLPFTFDKIISIQIDTTDLLHLQQISLLRAGDYNYDNDLLEINTFNKLNNIHYKWVLDTLIDNFFVNQVRRSYNAVKDTSWPDINNIDDFKKLPIGIQQECLTVHKLKLLELSDEFPDCPRDVLREFFQIGFANPEKSGFIVKQQQVKYNSAHHIHIFPFKCFYDLDQFLIEINKLVDWAQLNFNDYNKIELIHKEFLNRNPYKDSKNKCDNIIKQLMSDNFIKLSKLNLVEEAYINAMLNREYFT